LNEILDYARIFFEHTYKDSRCVLTSFSLIEVGILLVDDQRVRGIDHFLAYIGVQIQCTNDWNIGTYCLSQLLKPFTVHISIIFAYRSSMSRDKTAVQFVDLSKLQ